MISPDELKIAIADTRITAMRIMQSNASVYDHEKIAEAFGISASAVSKYAHGELPSIDTAINIVKTEAKLNEEYIENSKKNGGLK